MGNGKIILLGKETTNRIDYKKKGIINAIKNILYRDISKSENIETINNNENTENIENNTICPITQRMVDGIDVCIENDIDNIDIQYLEDHYPECDIDVYISTYKRLLQWIKDFLIKYQDEADKVSKSNLLMRIEEIKLRKEIKTDRIPAFLMLLSTYHNTGFEGCIKVEDIVDICNKSQYYESTPGIEFLKQITK